MLHYPRTAYFVEIAENLLGPKDTQCMYHHYEEMTMQKFRGDISLHTLCRHLITYATLLCMHRASYCSVYINQRDAQILTNNIYFSLFGSTCFGLSPVHHQEHHLVNCITHWYILAGESSCYVAVAARLACTNVPMRDTVYLMMLLMMDW